MQREGGNGARKKERKKEREGEVGWGGGDERAREREGGREGRTDGLMEREGGGGEAFTLTTCCLLNNIATFQVLNRQLVAAAAEYQIRWQGNFSVQFSIVSSSSKSSGVENICSRF